MHNTSDNADPKILTNKVNAKHKEATGFISYRKVEELFNWKEADLQSK